MLQSLKRDTEVFKCIWKETTVFRHHLHDFYECCVALSRSRSKCIIVHSGVGGGRLQHSCVRLGNHCPVYFCCDPVVRRPRLHMYVCDGILLDTSSIISGKSS